MRLTPSDASETMPRPLWNDHHHPGFQRIGLRPVLGHDVKSHRTVDDFHGAHGDRHHGVWYSGPEVRPVSADRERVPHRASLAGGQSDRRQHRRPAADRAGWRGDGFRRDPLPRDHARYRCRRGTAGPGGAAGHYTRGAAPPCWGRSCSSIWCTREPAGSQLGAAIGSELRRRYRRCRSLESSRIVDRECDMLGRLRWGGHQAHPLRRLENDATPLVERSPPPRLSAHRIAARPRS